MGDKNIRKEVKKKKKKETTATEASSSVVLRPVATQPELVKKEKRPK